MVKAAPRFSIAGTFGLLLLVLLPASADAKSRRASGPYNYGATNAFSWGPDFQYYNYPLYAGCPKDGGPPRYPVIATSTFSNQPVRTTVGSWSYREVSYGFPQQWCRLQ
jgi:hypothetical protein